MGPSAGAKKGAAKGPAAFSALDGLLQLLTQARELVQEQPEVRGCIQQGREGGRVACGAGGRGRGRGRGRAGMQGEGEGEGEGAGPGCRASKGSSREGGRWP